MAQRETSHRLLWLFGLLALLATYSAVWPVYRVFLPIEINSNESWNAFHADKAIKGQKLYPAPDELITNNYPPLSFIVVGAVGRVVGDMILAGRLLSLAAIVLIGLGVGRTILVLGGTRLAAWVGGLYFVTTMCRFFSSYAGMNDPQLLAHAVMVFGYPLFLKAIERDRGYLLPIVIMVIAGFIKHNIVMMPLIAFVWLGIRRPRRLLPLSGLALLIVALGLGLCRMAYGPDFTRNLLSPRVYDWARLATIIGGFQWHAVGLIAWIYVGTARRKVPEVMLCNLMVVTGVMLYPLQSIGDGVGDNSHFDMLIAISVAIGIAFTQAPHVLTRFRTPEQLRSGLLLFICLRFIALPNAEAIRLVIDSEFRAEIATRIRATEESVALARAVPGDILAPAFICYYAGKRHTIDGFNVDQRIKKGVLPKDIIEQKIAAGEFVRIEVNKVFNWGNELPK